MAESAVRLLFIVLSETGRFVKGDRVAGVRLMSHQDYQKQALLFYYFAKPCRVERRAVANAFTEITPYHP